MVEEILDLGELEFLGWKIWRTDENSTGQEIITSFNSDCLYKKEYNNHICFGLARGSFGDYIKIYGFYNDFKTKECLFSGHCPDIETFKTIAKLVNC